MIYFWPLLDITNDVSVAKAERMTIRRVAESLHIIAVASLPVYQQNLQAGVLIPFIFPDHSAMIK